MNFFLFFLFEKNLFFSFIFFWEGVFEKISVFGGVFFEFLFFLFF